MLARRDKIVARALGGGGGEDRRGDLQKAVLGHETADLGDDLAAEDDVLLHGRVTQIEEAVLQSRGLVGLAAAVDLKGQLVVAALAQHADRRGDDLDLAGGQLGVLAGTLAHRAGDGDRGFLVDRADRVHHVLTLDDELGRAVEVADDDEGERGGDGTDVFHPAGEGDGLADVGKTQLSAGVGTGLFHLFIPLFLFRKVCIRFIRGSARRKRARTCRRGSARRSRKRRACAARPSAYP